jgi:glycosyltransferase involved in cell wall biosynthesis
MATTICLVATDAISFNVLYRDQLEYFKQRGLHLTMVCGGSQTELERLRERKVGRVVDLGFVRWPAPLRDAYCLSRLILHFFANRYDVVLSTTPKAILLGSIASWITRERNRIVFFQGRVYENATGLKRRLFAWLDRLAIHLSTHAIFVSRSLLAAYEAEHLLPVGRGQVVGAGSVSGVDTERFAADRFMAAEVSAMKRALVIPDTALVATTIGRVCKDKGLGELKALAQAFVNDDIVFVVVGAVDRGHEGLASTLFAMPNVRHVPFTTEVAKYFAIADIHLFLSHREGFGNVAVEAASCGVPTVAFDVVGVKDSVADGVSGIRVPLGDLVAVRRVLEVGMQSGPAFRSRFSGARAWVESTYSRERVWQTYFMLFAQLR